jgi:hypothetical protein
MSPTVFKASNVVFNNCAISNLTMFDDEAVLDIDSQQQQIDAQESSSSDKDVEIGNSAVIVDKEPGSIEFKNGTLTFEGCEIVKMIMKKGIINITRIAGDTVIIKPEDEE